MLIAACVPPDEPPTLSERVPPEVLALLSPDTVRAVRVGPGVLYRFLWSPKGPVAVHVVESQLDRCDLDLDVLRAESRERGTRGHERVTSMVERAGSSVIAAVNADFFTAEGAPVGAEIVDGEVVYARARPTLAWKSDESLWIGTAEVEDERMSVGWPISREYGDDSTEAVGGFPTLLHEGQPVEGLESAGRAGFAMSPHPRTAVGYDDSGRFWLVVVDGRQAPHSTGMTLPDLADLLASLGATEALNLDGGGSTVLVLGGQAANSPSDAAGERPTVNALALRRDAAGCELNSRR